MSGDDEQALRRPRQPKEPGNPEPAREPAAEGTAATAEATGFDTMPRRLNRGLKMAYLVTNAAILPLAIAYLCAAKPSEHWTNVFFWGIYFIVPFWLTMFFASLLYYFPRDNRRAIFLLITQYVPWIACVCVAKIKLLYSIYAMFFNSFVSSILLWVVMIGMAIFVKRYRKHFGRVRWWIVVIFGVIFLVGLIYSAIFTYGLSKPLLAELGEIPSRPLLVLTIAAFACQVFGPFLHNVVAFTQGDPEKNAAESQRLVAEHEPDPDWFNTLGMLVYILTMVAALAVLVSYTMHFSEKPPHKHAPAGISR